MPKPQDASCQGKQWGESGGESADGKDRIFGKQWGEAVGKSAGAERGESAES